MNKIMSLKFGKWITLITVILSLAIIAVAAVVVVPSSIKTVKSNFKEVKTDFSKKLLDIKEKVVDPDAPEEPVEEKSTAEKFNVIFENYSEANAEIMKNTLSDFVKKQYGGGDDQQGEQQEVTPAQEKKQKYFNIVEGYVDNLFDGMGACKAKGMTDEEAEAYVAKEAAAFDSLNGYVQGALDASEPYNPEPEEINTLLETIADSDSAFTTIDNIVNDEGQLETMKGAFDGMDEGAKATIENACGEFAKAAQLAGEEGARQLETAQNLAAMIGMDLDAYLASAQ